MSAGQPVAIPWRCIFEDCTGCLPATPPNLTICPFCTREQTQAKMSAGQPVAIPWRCIFEDCTGCLPATPPNLTICPFCAREQTQKPKSAPESSMPSCLKCGTEFVREQSVCHLCGTKAPDKPPPARSDETVDMKWSKTPVTR